MTVAQRNELVVRHLPLVHAIARETARIKTGAVYDDFVSHGAVGLIGAAASFDVTRGVPFASYARRRIRGAMLDGRRCDDVVPRRARKLMTAYMRRHDELRHEIGAEPTRAQVFTDLRFGPRDVRSVERALAAAELLRLDDSVAGRSGVVGLVGDLLVERDADPAHIVERAELRNALRHALARLVPRERIVVVLCDVEGESQATIARALGITEARISQIRRTALLRLRAMLHTSEIGA
jgi:RNA polymerase sigma factor for flagellar operon FliA